MLAVARCRSGLGPGRELWGQFKQQSHFYQVRSFGRAFPRQLSSPQAPRPPSQISRGIFGGRRLVISGGLLFGCFAVYEFVPMVHDGVDFTFHAVQRSTTVMYALFRSMWIYHRVLNKEYPDKETEEAAYAQAHLKAAHATRAAIERNKGLFIKLGQHIAALTYIFPPEWTETMIPLQDQAPVSSFESIKELIEHDEGRPLDQIFSYLAEEPLGTASLAQVHRARLLDGSPVAVKVQHPELEKYVPLDVALTKHVLGMLDYFFPQYPLSWLSDEIQRSVYNELDFREEARNATNTAEYFEPFYSRTALRVPKVYWAKRRILCMEFVSGGRPDDLEYLDEIHVDRADLSACFAHIFNNMIFTPGVGMHCDPHAGNIAVRAVSPQEQKDRDIHRNFEIILYDHGLYRYVPTETRRAYSHLWLALLAGDKDAMRRYAKEFAKVDDNEFNLFTAAITGRAFSQATSNVVSKRDKSERELMAKTIQEQNLWGSIMQLLNRMPPVVLLILKTNDLTRYLDEKLDSPLGVVRSFLIMAQYCANTVFQERKEMIQSQHRRLYDPRCWWAYFRNWWDYMIVSSELTLYDFYVWLRPSKSLPDRGSDLSDAKVV